MTNERPEDSFTELEEILCPLCGTRPFRLVHHVFDRLSRRTADVPDSPQEEPFRLVACSSCGFLYLNPRPKAEHLGRYYPAEAYDPHRQTGGGLMGFAYRLLRPFSVGYKAKKVTQGLRPGRILDVGCGSGEFLEEMQRRGWQVLGIEKDPSAAQAASAKGIRVLVGDPAEIALPDERFDLITFWHSLEHLPYLKKVAERLGSRVSPGGRLALALPNPDSLDARFYGPRWVAWDAPRHLYHFRRRDLETLWRPEGFKWESSFSLPLDSFYHALLSEICWSQSKAFPFRALRGLLIGCCSYGVGFKQARGSSALYIMKKV